MPHVIHMLYIYYNSINLGRGESLKEMAGLDSKEMAGTEIREAPEATSKELRFILREMTSHGRI